MNADLVLLIKFGMEVDEKLGMCAPNPHNFVPKTAQQGIPEFDAGITIEEGLEVLTKMDPQEGFPFGAGDMPTDYISAITTPKEYSWGAVS